MFHNSRLFIKVRLDKSCGWLDCSDGDTFGVDGTHQEGGQQTGVFCLLRHWRVAGQPSAGVGVCACLLPRCSYSYRGEIHSLIGSGFRGVMDYGESGFGARHMALSHVNILGHCWGYLIVSREISLRGWLVEMRWRCVALCAHLLSKGVSGWMDTRSFVCKNTSYSWFDR